MAERQPGPGPSPGQALSTSPRRPLSISSSPGALLLRLRDHAPNSSQFVGFLTLIVSGAILLLLTGITLTGAVMALIFFSPLVLLTSPIWVPAGLVMFVAAAVVVSACGFGVAALAGASWLYRYFMGRHPSAADVRSRVAGAASHLKDYASEYGGYIRGRVKDAAPGA